MFGKNEASMRKRERRKIFIDLAETAAANTVYYACYTSVTKSPELKARPA